MNSLKFISLALGFVAITLISTACTETAPPANSPRPSAAASPAAPSPSPSVDEFATARANYEKHCVGCHGEQGTGGRVKVENKQIKVPSLKADHAIKHTDDELIKRITNGEEEMPPFKDKLSAQEITELVRFVRKEYQGK